MSLFFLYHNTSSQCARATKNKAIRSAHQKVNPTSNCPKTQITREHKGRALLHSYPVTSMSYDGGGGIAGGGSALLHGQLKKQGRSGLKAWKVMQVQQEGSRVSCLLWHACFPLIAWRDSCCSWNERRWRAQWTCGAFLLAPKGSHIEALSVSCLTPTAPPFSPRKQQGIQFLHPGTS